LPELALEVELPELALGFRLVEPVAAALVLPEFAPGARLVDPVALAVVLLELGLGAGLVGSGASGAELPLFPPEGLLAAVICGVLAGPYALPGAAVVGFCARAEALPKAITAASRITICH
jgi:hypothetical protein